MKNPFLPGVLFLLSLLLWQCQTDSVNMTHSVDKAAFETIAVAWELNSNQVLDKPQFKAEFTLTNNGKTTLGAQGWALYFSHSPRKIVAEAGTGPGKVEQVKGDFYRLIPNSDFELKAGETQRISYQGGAWLIKEIDGPAGLYFALNQGAQVKVKDYTIIPFTRVEQSSRHKADQLSVPTPASVFEQNKRVQLLSSDETLAFIPAPASIRKTGKNLTIDPSYKIYYTSDLVNEARQLQEGIISSLGVKLFAGTGETNGAKHIVLRVGKTSKGGAESYDLTTSASSGIQITGQDAAGVFYGIQSLLALFPPELFGAKKDRINLPEVQIADAPRFPYRGVMLDVGRNFQSKEAVLKVLDAMGAYKLNKLHMHLTEDEGWRLEINGLPELTNLGSRRGHTLDDQEFLQPAYGSGPDPESTTSSGNGFYTRRDFIQLLRYAKARHIEVIPEINMPGHARAAIKAMEARFRNMSSAGKTEGLEKYRLIDGDDQSKYESVQHYPDNVVCVCRESVYAFYEAVVDDVKAMYEEAGLQLKTIHTGGDEVPAGVWMDSPSCKELLKARPELNEVMAMQSYFFDRVSQLLEARDIVAAGWEEIVLKKEADGRLVPNAAFANRRVLPYVWNNLWGNQDLGYRMANAGYPIVVCFVSNLYFDLAYTNDPKEPGLYWGGFIDTRKAYELIPLNVFQSLEKNVMGNPHDRAKDFKDMERLRPDAQDKVVGLQGQLWSETLQRPDMLEYYLLPKMLGLAERAWASTPAWAKPPNDAAHAAGLAKDWNRFANTIGQKELLRLDHRFGGYGYRLPPPGAQIKNGQLAANIAFPGLSIRYTTDGTEPNEKSSVYEKPVAVSGVVTLASFDSRGRRSALVRVGE